ncbi:unnamed protein product, partial [Mycena citricolor]
PTPAMPLRLDDLEELAPPGYESDTSDTALPTCEDLRLDRPVTRTPRSAHARRNGRPVKALNRPARAICRILAAHGWSNPALGAVFGVSGETARRAVRNVLYSPRDRVEEDYDRVDPEFRVLYPPVGGSNNGSDTKIGPNLRAYRRTDPAVEEDDDAEDDEEIQCLGIKRRGQKPQPPQAITGNQDSDTQHQRPAPSRLAQFLQSVPDVNLTQHLSFLESQGLNSANLHTVALWPADAIQHMIEVLLLGTPPARDGRRVNGLTATEAVWLEVELRRLRRSVGGLAQPMSPPSGATLRQFLRNVLGLDLSCHHDLIVSQGLDGHSIRTLCLAEVVPLSKLGDMTPLEVLAVEIARIWCGNDNGAKS